MGCNYLCLPLIPVSGTTLLLVTNVYIYRYRFQGTPLAIGQNVIDPVPLKFAWRLKINMLVPYHNKTRPNGNRVQKSWDLWLSSFYIKNRSNALSSWSISKYVHTKVTIWAREIELHSAHNGPPDSFTISMHSPKWHIYARLESFESWLSANFN